LYGKFGHSIPDYIISEKPKLNHIVLLIFFYFVLNVQKILQCSSDGGADVAFITLKRPSQPEVSYFGRKPQV
jgi:hypothetical protein